MDFTVGFYETVVGRCPVREFLLELKASDPGDFAAVAAGLEKLRHRQNHRAPLTKAIGDGLFELRHVGKLNSRVLWFFVKGAGLLPSTASAPRVKPCRRATWIRLGNGCATGKKEKSHEKDEL